MGKSKAELEFCGKTLIEHQTEKLRLLGIDDIIVSGYPKPVEGTRFVADKYPLKGPLGGIHAGLSATEHPHCLVLSVDAPLVPSETLAELIDSHVNGSANITVVSHGGKLEPLIGMYERWLSTVAEPILQGENTSVRELFRKAGLTELEYSGDEALLINCNTPDEYEALSAIKKTKTTV